VLAARYQLQLHGDVRDFRFFCWQIHSMSCA
jgi:hypothetical protein